MTIAVLLFWKARRDQFMRNCMEIPQSTQQSVYSKSIKNPMNYNVI